MALPTWTTIFVSASTEDGTHVLTVHPRIRGAMRRTQSLPFRHSESLAHVQEQVLREVNRAKVWEG